MGVDVSIELSWSVEFGVVSGSFASNHIWCDPLTTVACLCMILSFVFESANLAFESAHLFIKSLLYARPHVKSWDSKVKLNEHCLFVRS